MKISRSELKGIISESLFKILRESCSDEIESIPENLSILQNKYQSYAEEVGIFMREYNEFQQCLKQVIEKYGLTMTNCDCDCDRFFEGASASFRLEYDFSVNGVDTESMDDNAYDEYMSKIEDMISNIEIDMYYKSYKSCNVSVEIGYGDGIRITCEFDLWE